MTDMNDTKPLPETTPKDAPPDVAEGDDMPITLGLLNTQVQILRIEVDALKQRFETLMTPQQIRDMYNRVEELVDAIAKIVEDNIEGINNKLAIRAQNAAASDQKLDRVIQFINTLAADDVTDPDSKKTGKSWFERMEEAIRTSDERSLSAVVEISQYRVDHVEAMHEMRTGIEAVNVVAADLKPLALSVARAQTLIDIGLRLAKRPRLAFGLFVAAFAAFGGGAVLTPELLRLIGNTIVNVFTGANQP